PLGLTGLISLQSKGLSRVFSNITVQKHQFFAHQASLSITNSRSPPKSMSIESVMPSNHLILFSSSHQVAKVVELQLQRVGAARSGNLTFMVGGVEEEFAAAQELLGCMGSNVVYCGAVGTGQAAKICNNLLLAISMIGTAEAMNLGIRLGLDPKLLAKILNMSSGRCWSSDTYNPVPGVMDGVPSANNYQGGFGTTLMAKDLGLAQDSATSTKTPILLGSQAHQIYRMMCAKGYSKKDFSSVFQFLREEETF
ncbi:hypothetical protein FD755_012112, partial [Muntiacus reevesi]